MISVYMFARTVVRNQEVPFPMTVKRTAEVPERYARVFPRTEDELVGMLEESAAAPLESCASQAHGAERIRERMG